MNISPDDPRLTAFALGEIDDGEEAKKIQAAVEASPELREAVEAIRSVASTLEEALAGEPAPEIDETTQAVLRQIPLPVTDGPAPVRRFFVWPMVAIAAAAAVALMLVVSPAFRPDRTPAFQHASSPEKAASEESPALEEPVRRDTAKPPAPPLESRAAPSGVQRESAEFFDAVPDAVAEFAPAERTASAPVRLRAAEADPKSQEARIRELLLAARAHYLNGDLMAAEQVLRELLALDPNHDEAGKLLQQIAQEKVRRERLDREQAHAEMLAAVDAGWQRPQVYVDREMPISRPARPQFGFAPAEDTRWPGGKWNLDAYDPIEETGFRSPRVAPLSTFSIDVDTASYAHVRSILSQGRLPPASAVRVEEFINYFPYEDVAPSTSPEEGGAPFAVHLEQGTAPWAPEHRLLRVALKGYEIPWDERPPSNLVFLIDVSGSMNRENRLPLVKEALGLLVDRLDERDRVAIVVYAGTSSLTLPSTTANNRETIRHAIDQLVAQGSTHASDGLQRAYEIARKHFIEGGNNRVILCTDGDFNVGITDRGELGEFVQEQAGKGVSLTVLGFGMGNYKDNMLETLSAKGKGGYGYIDSSTEARKFFLQQLTGNLFTIAHDVKIQVEFNPAEVNAYRLIGYENRRLNPEDFNDDEKRAGDIGPGHTVTAFYEIVPAGVAIDLPGTDPLRYQTVAPEGGRDQDGEIATVKVRYKRPGEDASELIVGHLAAAAGGTFDERSPDFRFGAAVAAFGMRLGNSEYIGDFDWQEIRRIALNALGRDPGGHRSEFIQLVDRAAKLSEAK